MFKALVVANTPFLYDVLRNMREFQDMILFEYAPHVRSGYDLVVADKNVSCNGSADVLTFKARPIEIADVVAKIEACLSKRSTIAQLHDITLDTVTRIVSSEAGSIQLTEVECKLLHGLMLAFPGSITREHIKTEILSYNNQVQTSTIENHIYHLRAKLASCSNVIIESTVHSYALRIYS